MIAVTSQIDPTAWLNNYLLSLQLIRMSSVDVDVEDLCDRSDGAGS